MAGRIRRVFPSADTLTRLVPVEVALTGPAAREARPGFLARLHFRLEARGGMLLVPAGLLVAALLALNALGEALRARVRAADD